MMLPDQLKATVLKPNVPFPRFEFAQDVLGSAFDILGRPLRLPFHRFSIEEPRCRRSCPNSVPFLERHCELSSLLVVQFEITIIDCDILSM
jgi:hypothetical protein